MRHDFLLPDELGWKANDEVSEYMDTWIKEVSAHQATKLDPVAWEVGKAMLMDNIYATIKKYQKEEI